MMLVVSIAGSAFARYPNDFKPTPRNQTPVLVGRSDCNQGTSRFDMDVNNVRAALLASGDVWWDLDKGVYVVPKIARGTGAREVSSIFAGAVWVGGKDPSGNLKLCAQTYRSATKNDFWPGPLNERTGQTDAATCTKWDKHFVVTATEIDSVLKLWRNRPAGATQIECSLVPDGVKGWPAFGNDYFRDVHGFALPSTRQGLAKFHDENGNTKYEPCAGDYPIIDVKGCNISVYPDQMVFWIYNDNGNVHTQSARSVPIQMEIQVQAFAYKTNDELNDMTFQRYKLINRAVTDIDSCYFAMWVDPDLGCHTDDYVGCDTTRSLAYVYNEDAIDGTTGSVCDGGVATYGDKVPILGVDYFRGPNDQTGKELGMSSFTYYLNGGVGNPDPATTDPSSATEFYNYLTGKWRNGTPFSFGGSGYNPGSTRVLKYAFPDAPDNPAGWSMVTARLPNGDRRTIQATGPLVLKPGAVNELIVGVPWVPDQKFPFSVRRLQEADDIAQALFDNCFKIFDGPDAPDMTFVELDRKVIAVISNAPGSNNYQETYSERGLKIPGLPNIDTNYVFEGYKVYQLANADVSVADLADQTKARLIAQVDLNNSVKRIFNWTTEEDPNFPGRDVYTPVAKTENINSGIRYSFEIENDLFATGEDKKLINHKKYYYLAITYGYNNYKVFDAKTGGGQPTPYVVGRRNIGDPRTGGKAYEVLPRPINYVRLRADYGDGPAITRLDGDGNGGNFVDISTATMEEILKGTNDPAITYVPGRGPINVKVVNPLEVVNGDYTLTLEDADLTDTRLDAVAARWKLKRTGDTAVLASERTIEKLNEQIVARYGFSVSVGQVKDVGVDALTETKNGAIGSEIQYLTNGADWLDAVQDDEPYISVPGIPAMTNFIKNAPLEDDYNLDPFQSLSTMSRLFKPYLLCDYNGGTRSPLFSPVWSNAAGATIRSIGSIQQLPNVNIVLTKDKSKWTRCVVVETSMPYLSEAPQGQTRPRFPAENDAKQFEIRKKPSVGKEAGADGLPIADGDGQGMGWFPGYAIDVETGRRLNMMFGEASSFDPEIGTYENDSKGITRDMVWNPSSQRLLANTTNDLGYTGFFGGHHFVYVSTTTYDSCKNFRIGGLQSLDNLLRRPQVLRTMAWTMFPVLKQGTKMLSYKDGLIPTDAVIKLRVNNPYSVKKYKGTNGNHPSYQFKIESAPEELSTTSAIDSALNYISVVPNPYYGASAYEVNELSTVAKITNLPLKSTITIYTLDGKFIRQFRRDERPSGYASAGTREKQTTPDLEWDLKNEKGIPIASGVYLIHVDGGSLGQRTIKFFVINRQFDPSRL